MTKKQALEVLEAHNKWRRGSDEIPMQEPEDIGKALEVAIKALKKQAKTKGNEHKTNE